MLLGVPAALHDHRSIASTSIVDYLRVPSRSNSTVERPTHVPWGVRLLTRCDDIACLATLHFEIAARHPMSSLREAPRSVPHVTHATHHRRRIPRQSCRSVAAHAAVAGGSSGCAAVCAPSQLAARHLTDVTPPLLRTTSQVWPERPAGDQHVSSGRRGVAGERWVTQYPCRSCRPRCCDSARAGRSCRSASTPHLPFAPPPRRSSVGRQSVGRRGRSLEAERRVALHFIRGGAAGPAALWASAAARP